MSSLDNVTIMYNPIKPTIAATTIANTIQIEKPWPPASTEMSGKLLSSEELDFGNDTVW